MDRAERMRTQSSAAVNARRQALSRRQCDLSTYAVSVNTSFSRKFPLRNSDKMGIKWHYQRS